jgi:Protein of unknown function (DUF4019)
MSEKKNGGCIGCLGSLAVLTLIGSLFFGGGVLYRVGSWNIALGRDPIDRQPIIASYLNDLETSKKVSNESTQNFRTQIEQGQYQAVYDRASEAFKKSLTTSQWVGFCETFKQRFGSVKSVQLMDAWVQATDKESEKYVLLRYMTTFSKVHTQENFTWIVKDGKPELIQYEIFATQISPGNDPKNTQVISLIN